VNACGEHVNPESTCTIRLCLWKQESPDFRQGSVQDWISSLQLKNVDLVYSDKENSQGIQFTISLIDNSDISFSYYFK